jgi:hypothetical protein
VRLAARLQATSLSALGCKAASNLAECSWLQAT